MPSVWVNDGGTLREIKEIAVNDGGTLRNITEGWVNDGGTLRQFFGGGSAIDWAGSPVDCQFVDGGGALGGSLVHSGQNANCVFDPGSDFPDVLNTWTDSGTDFSLYEVRMRAVNSTNLPSSGSPLSTWLNAGSPQVWVFTNNLTTTTQQIMEWDYRLAGDNSTIQTRTYLLNFTFF